MFAVARALLAAVVTLIPTWTLAQGLLLDDHGEKLVRLPWGSRVARSGETVVLPDRRRGRLSEGELIAWDELDGRFTGDGGAVVNTARGWMGVPYLWGGRTRWGADCSGFVQAVYRLHGFLLPRDSYQQVEYGEPVEIGGEFEGLRPGDLVFFKAADSDKIVHVAFCVGEATIVHAELQNGVIQEDVLGVSSLGSELLGRVAAVRRFWV